MTARDLEEDEENRQVEALWRQAARHFEECLRRDPSADEAARLLAVCAIRLGDGPRAIRAMTVVVRLNPEEFTAHRALAWTYIHAGRVDDGIRELRLALRYVKDPSRRLACVAELVEQLRRTGRLEESVRLLEAERERPSSAPRLRILLAETYAGLGCRDRAIETCREWLDTVPDFDHDLAVEALQLLAREYSSLRRFEEGLRVLRDYLSRAPDNWRLLESRARLLQSAGDTSTAIEEVERFADRHPKQSAPLLLLGELHEARDDLGAAVGVFRRILREHPTGSTALRRFGASKLMEIGDRYAAVPRPRRAAEIYRAALDGALTAAPSLERSLRLRLSRVLSMDEQFEKALKTLEPLLKSGRTDVEVYRAYVNSLWDAGRQTEAVRAAQRGLKLFADHPAGAVEMHRLLSTFYIRLGRPRQGESELLRALRQNPTHPDALNDLGYLYATEGRKLEEAVRLIKDAHRLRGDDDPVSLDSLAWAYYKIALRDDNLQMAISAYRLLERAAQGGANSTILHHLGDVAFVLGMWRNAEKAWAESCESETRREADLSLCSKKLKALRRHAVSGAYPKPSMAARRPLASPERRLGLDATAGKDVGFPHPEEPAKVDGAAAPEL